MNVFKRLKRLRTPLTTKEGIFEDGHAIGQSPPKAHGFVGGAPDRGDLSPRDCQIEHGGSTPLQLADPPSLEMLARKRGPVHTQFGPILATIRERPPKNTRRGAEIVVS
jgi:hypothetical protein